MISLGRFLWFSCCIAFIRWILDGDLALAVGIVAGYVGKAIDDWLFERLLK